MTEITPIESAYLNMNTATNDILWAKIAWENEEMNESLRNITEAVRQLEAAKVKLEKHIAAQ